MYRNIDDHFSKQPIAHLPRTRHVLNVTSRKTSQGHGKLTPFFYAPVFPGDTYSIKMAASCRMDTSLRVPLDEVYDDIYFFFVPYRIIDKDFAKVLGERDGPYDTGTYSFPQILFEPPYELSAVNFLPGYLGYGVAEYDASVDGQGYRILDTINAYPIRSYWKIWNDFFRDENLDSAVDVEGISSASASDIYQAQDDILQLATVNKFHDYFTSGLISAIKGPEVYIPGASTAPVGVIATSSSAATSGTSVQFASGGAVDEGDLLGMIKNGGTYGGEPVVTDLSNSYGTIAQLTLAMQLYQLYDTRARFGTRYIETIRGQWGVEVPDGLLQRPEYLGGTQVTLNNMPVLDTTSSGLGAFAGNSATTFAGASFTKSFVEYGMIIGLSVTRVKHSYGQGVDPTILDMVDEFDMYNPLFANIGNTKTKNREIYNVPGQNTQNEQAFNYQEAWSRLRNIPDSFSGLFANITQVGASTVWAVTSSLELRSKWSYQDMYSSLPVFSTTWLKESDVELRRTMTGRLIPGATEEGGHQFLFNYMVQPTITRILPGHSRPASLLNRL